MPKLTRRNVLRTGIALAIPPGMVTLIGGCKPSSTDASQQAESSDQLASSSDQPAPETQESNLNEGEEPMKIQYLEIVTPEVDALCRQYSTIYDITFGEPDANLGNARTAKLDSGGMIGIRGPMRETETPVVRPYLLVNDIEAAVESAKEAGAEVAIPPMEIPEHGKFAIVINGGIDCGFWQI